MDAIWKEINKISGGNNHNIKELNNYDEQNTITDKHDEICKIVEKEINNDFNTNIDNQDIDCLFQHPDTPYGPVEGDMSPF